MSDVLEPRLFRLGVEACHLSLYFTPGLGWSAHLTSRRQGEVWGEEPSDDYDRLTLEEAYEVACAALAGRLGL